ncbi:OLC1v1031291C1 [Oldenlandia corymbosa var. corymbosa]|uniref:OLC1v1031291C1 n=1 Tax=Oldenlandia corymbosa var. corymbosa TaxID=529605 RepID=A0AAV1CJS3_OLDCO|nr:OLC1v1031291C1 [Oldenlandia corymbosa var. corymbosa]
MSLNCLKGMKRTDSDTEMRDTLCQEKANIHRFLTRIERSWSGNIGEAPNFGKMRTGSSLMADPKAKVDHPYRTRHSAPAHAFDAASPRLVRSSGMRRDWSFEDLRRGVQGY